MVHGPPQTASLSDSIPITNLRMRQQLGFKTQTLTAFMNGLEVGSFPAFLETTVCPSRSSMFMVNLKTFTIGLLGPLLKFKITHLYSYWPIVGPFPNHQVCQRCDIRPPALSPHAPHTDSDCGGSSHTS